MSTEYVLTGGRKCVIFQLVDDHGVLQRLLSDNGLALNPSRRDRVGRLVAHVTALGTEAKPIHPARSPTGPSTSRRYPPCGPDRSQAYPPAHNSER